MATPTALELQYFAQNGVAICRLSSWVNVLPYVASMRIGIKTFRPTFSHSRDTLAHRAVADFRLMMYAFMGKVGSKVGDEVVGGIIVMNTQVVA